LKKIPYPTLLRGTLICAGLVCTPVFAQTLPLPDPAATRAAAEQEQRLRQQQEAQERERTLQAPDVRSAIPKAAGFPVLSTEQPCFQIYTFRLEVPDEFPADVRVRGASSRPQDPFTFARKWLEHYQGQCLGRQGIDLLAKTLSRHILSRGMITTRVLVPEQDISQGTLTLTLIPGIIHALRFADSNTFGTWKSAFPTRAGDLLNLRDLEQGLEQMKHVASQDVEMQIMPTKVLGQSDVVLTVKRGKPWTVCASIDNSGTRATGRLQGKLSLGLDNPLGLNDIFNLGVNHDLSFSDKRFGSQGWNAFYSVPWGYWTGSLSAYASHYDQQIAGANQTFVSSGLNRAGFSGGSNF
jgi:hemolysin activation/secretion protein